MTDVADAISPELVLVDPELAARLRPTWSPPLPTAPSVDSERLQRTAWVAADAARDSRGARILRQLRNVALVLSLALNVLAVTTLLDDSTSVPASAPTTRTTAQAPALVPPPSGATPAAATRQRQKAERQALETAAEQQLLADLGRIPALRHFADPATGLSRSGVSAQCRPSAGTARTTLLRCRVWRPASPAAKRQRAQYEVSVRCSRAGEPAALQCVAR